MLNIRTSRFEQFDQGLHCLSFYQYVLDTSKGNQTDLLNFYAFQKHAYSNILKILPPKNKNFQMKNSDIFHISAQIDFFCVGTR